MRARVVCCALLGAAVVLAWPAEAATTSATIQGSAFHPDPLTITAGDTVTWTNKDVATHTVTDEGPAKTFDSGNIAFNGTYTHTFNTAGNFTYYCTIHGFEAKLTVKAAAATTKPATTTTKPAATTTTTKPTTTTTSTSTTTSTTSTTVGGAVSVDNATTTTSTTPAGAPTAALPKHHDSAVGPLLAALAVVLAAIAAVAVYLFRRRREGY